jgi:hypothetical protein
MYRLLEHIAGGGGDWAFQLPLLHRAQDKTNA